MKTIMISSRRFIFLLISISCFTICNFPSYTNSLPININEYTIDEGAYFEPEKPKDGSLEEMYQDVFMTMLLPYIQKAVDGYYEKNTGYSPSVDPWQPKIIYITRPNGYRTFLFEMILEVMPYLGAHNSIGVDHITIRVSSGEVKVEKYEHIKDKPIPPWLQRNDIQNKKSIDSMSTNSIQQADWGSLNCQQKEYFLERLIMVSFSTQMQEAVDNYYLTQRGFDIDKIIDVKLVGAYEYEMQIQISTYTEAHNPPHGVDIVTIQFSHLCDGKVVKYEHKDKECISDSKPSNLNQKIQTKSYSFTVPNKWRVKTDGIEAEFYSGDKRIGEVAKYGFLIYGNHYDLLEEKHLQGFSTDVLMARLARSKPAAANDDTITEELHFYFADKITDKKLSFGSENVYDIAFLTEYVQKATALEIIKTFRLR